MFQFKLQFTSRAQLFLSHLKPNNHHQNIIVNQQLRNMASSTRSPISEVVFKRQDSSRFVILNRPKQLNALNTNMINLMTPQLEAWQYSDIVKCVVLLPNEGSKAFCAGGDVKTITEKAASGLHEDLEKSLQFFKLEYKLNHLIGTFGKPFISVMDGITMGGGVGLSVHAPFRIATEKTVFAMPETKIGFFPDVGGSFFLPRLDGQLGTFLGLTGEVLKGEEVYMAGIATHFIPSNRLPLLLGQLTQLETDNREVINGLLNEFSGDAVSESKWKQWRFGGENRKLINRCFSAPTVEKIVENLKNEESNNPLLAQKIIEDLSKRSPTAMKVTLMQLQKGAKVGFKDAFKMELGLASAFLTTPDFIEGVRAVLVDKDNQPRWNPTFDQLSSISEKDIENKYFKAPSKIHDAMEFTNENTYYDYPHRTMSSLPTSKDVKNVIQGTAQRGRHLAPLRTKNEVKSWFQREWGSFDQSVMGTNDASLPATVSIENGVGRGNVGLVPKVNYLLDEMVEEVRDLEGHPDLKLLE